MTAPKDFTVPFKDKRLTVHAEWIYESDQIQRIKVSIGKNFMVLQNDFPIWKAMNSRKRIDWKIKEGMFKDATFFWHLKRELEEYIRNPEPQEKKHWKSW